MSNRKDWRCGASACFANKLDESVLEAYAAANIKSTEISFRNDYYDQIEWNKIPQWVQNTGTEVWSIHLPFARNSENIAHRDPEVVNASLLRHHDLIGRAGNAGVKVVVVHPSSEPIADGDRPLLLERSAESLGKLCARAKEFNMQVAVEDLPRTCVGNCSEEIRFLLDANPDLRVCFDTNHLLKDTNVNFVRSVGDKIITLHVSDYDFIDEKHVIPGYGLIHWKELMTELERANYRGPFMYELSVKDIDGQRTLEDLRRNYEWLMSL